MKIINIPFFALLIFFSACTSAKVVRNAVVENTVERSIIRQLDSLNLNYGFVVKDRVTGQIIAKKNENNRFDPASNVKIFTLLSAVSFLRDSLLTFKYIDDANTRYLLPMGDPSFLHPQFGDGTALNQLKAGPDTLVIYFPETQLTRFGPGWAWDDYLYKFSSERSSLPLFGNCLNIMRSNSGMELHPRNFGVKIVDKEAIGYLCYREETSNDFYLRNSWGGHDMLSVPFIWSEDTAMQIIADYTGKVVKKGEDKKENSWFKYEIKNVSRDTVLNAMFKNSDNFLAEQLIINIGMQEWGTSTQAIPYLRNLLLPESWSDYKFVDGSGLSNYNYASPLTIIGLLELLAEKGDADMICSYFPVAGEKGSLSGWEKEETPYFFAKTGRKTGVRTLSGYLDTANQGKYVFSFMFQGVYGSVKGLDDRLSTILKMMHKEM